MLFFISFLFVFSSSYFIASALTKEWYEHIAYVLLTAFSQIVISFEILSLFSAISVQNVLVLNFVFWIVSLLVWLKHQKTIFIPDFKLFLKKYLNICKIDKTFIVLTFCFLVFVAGVLFLVSIMPITNADAVDYHVARSVFYILNGSLNHFDIADSRALMFPFNSEILYAWILLLLKKEAFLGFISFFGYLFSMISLFKFMQLAKFSFRKIIWSIFLVSSFASVIVQVSGTETDVLTSSLILSSIVLFWISFKRKSYLNLFFSSLAYALAVGVKTTAIIAIPAVVLIMLYLSFINKNYRNFGKFCLFFILNFILVSAYLYVINFIDYGNIVGSKAIMVTHKNFYGIKGFVANFIRHIFLFIDFSGFQWGEYIGKYILAVKVFILKFLHVFSIPEGIYSKPAGAFEVNGTLIEPNMSFGILGFLVLLPTLIYSLIKPLFCKNFKVKFLAVLSLSYFIFIALLSYLIVYMNFNGRFLAMFVIISAPVLSYSYFRKNNLLKVFLIICMFYYLVLVSSHLWARSWWHYAKNMIYKGDTISDTRLKAKCANYSAKRSELIDPNCVFWFKFKNKENLANSKVLYIPNAVSNIFLPATLDYFYNMNIDFGILPKINTYNLQKYDYIIFSDKTAYITAYDEKNFFVNYEINGNKITLKERKPYYCFYLQVNKKDTGHSDFSKVPLKDFPYAIECLIDSDFMYANNFYKMQVVNSNNTNNDVKFKFVVYKNMNK